MALFFPSLNYRVSIESKARGVKEKWLMPTGADADFLPAAFHSEVTLHGGTPYILDIQPSWKLSFLVNQLKDCSMSLKLSPNLLSPFTESLLYYYIRIPFSFQIQITLQEEEQSTSHPQKIRENR